MVVHSLLQQPSMKSKALLQEFILASTYYYMQKQVPTHYTLHITHYTLHITNCTDTDTLHMAQPTITCINTLFICLDHIMVVLRKELASVVMTGVWDIRWHTTEGCHNTTEPKMRTKYENIISEKTYDIWNARFREERDWLHCPSSGHRYTLLYDCTMTTWCTSTSSTIHCINIINNTVLNLQAWLPIVFQKAGHSATNSSFVGARDALLSKKAHNLQIYCDKNHNAITNGLKRALHAVAIHLHPDCKQYSTVSTRSSRLTIPFIKPKA